MATTQLPVREPTQRRQAEPAFLDPALWRHMLQQVKTQHPALARTWFDQMTPRLMPNGVINIQVASAAQLHFCQNQCQQAFTTAAQSITGRLTSVIFHFDAGTGGIFNDADQPIALNPDYAFENFVTGPCNRLPHAASIAVAEQPGKAYNPLFIHGDVGLGKTHLLQAVCQRILDRQPDARILYLTCDSFINQFINAVGSGDMNQFRYRYRHVDMLVIDDIHFLGGDKARTQEEFFHTFNTLYQGHKQIVLSADCPPSEIPELEDRLVSRFNWGLVARIDKPCYETRMAILQKKAQMRGISLPDDVLCYVASKIDANTRELEGAVTKIQGLASLHDGRVDLELAKVAFGETATPEQRRITFQQIFDVVTKYYNVRLSDLQSKKRHKSIAFPRQVCMYLARKYTRYSLEEIGGHFGGRDHTTVLHAVRTVTADMKADSEVANQLTQIENHLAV
ncbi:MAG TPA: chromosomal replication initiator protein DnaA [Tepidisphaeraceae bacterium]|nr:chromosomal replication initiator protein DnaA [Tepidisphaeraceae bacterium]